MIVTSVTPLFFSCSRIICSIGLPFTSIIAFGIVSVSGLKRVPAPAARTTACMKNKGEISCL